MTCVPSRRLCYALGFVSAAGLIAFALYLQHALGEDPCPLCIFQRVAMISLGGLFLLAALTGPGRWHARLFAAAIGLTAAAGAGIAARHVWIQHLPPDQVPSCGPGLNYILQAHPLFQALAVVLKGSGECAAQGWTFLSLSIPEWTLLWFVALGLLGALQPFNRRP